MVKSLRGRRTQTMLSRRLGFSTNVIYTWESGRRHPSAGEVLRLARIVKKPSTDVLTRFFGTLPDWFDSQAEDKETARRLLVSLRAKRTITDLSDKSGMSRYAVSRILKGQAEPRFSEFLLLVEVMSSRMLDLVAALVDPLSLSSLRERWQELERRRRIGIEFPWAIAIQSALETKAYRSTASHEEGALAALLGIDIELEIQCIDALQKAGLIEWKGCHFYPIAPATVDTSSLDEGERAALRAHWAQVGVDAILTQKPGVYSWNVFSVSSEDLVRLQELQRAYFRSIRSLVASSEQSEHVVVTNLQLFSFGEADF